jgi:hypothetical protein
MNDIYYKINSGTKIIKNSVINIQTIKKRDSGWKHKK